MEDEGTQTRLEESKKIYAQTKDPRQAIARYCQGNVWATDMAKAVGNLPDNY